MANENIQISTLLELLVSKPNDTNLSKAMFHLEEGYEDYKIRHGFLNKSRRDWLVLADINNNGNYTQKFHLMNYLQWKLCDGSLQRDTIFRTHAYRYLRNSALILYVREVVFEDDINQIMLAYTNACSEYIYSDECVVNTSPGYAKGSLQ